MDDHEFNPPAIPCESDAWPYSSDIAEFEARRAVGQLVRTHAEELRDLLPVAAYIVSVVRLQAALAERVLPELVARARELGVPWSYIGATLGVGDTAAQKRFGQAAKAPVDDRLKAEAYAAGAMGRIMLDDPWAGRPLEKEKHLEGIAGEPEESKLAYAANMAESARAACAEGYSILSTYTTDEQQQEKAYARLAAGFGMVATAAHAAFADTDHWETLISLHSSPANPDDTHYHHPITYVVYAYRQLMFAWKCGVLMAEPGPTTYDKLLTWITLAIGALETAVAVLRRSDVQSLQWPLRAAPA